MDSGAPVTVAALYVDRKRGPYATLPGVEAWGIAEDATTYTGPHPVVAHPPCGHWGRYAHRCHDDGHTGPIAVAQVRRWGGVLEHPRHSKLWKHCGLPRPGDLLPDAWGGYTIEVFQRDFEHRADKPTWLYVVGCPVLELPTMPPPAPPREAHQPKRRQLTADPDMRRRFHGTRGVVELMSKTQRHLTTPAFAAWLVELARRCKV